MSLLTSAFGMVIYPMLARGLGPQEFGSYILVMTWINSQIPLVEFGLNTVLNRDLAIEPEQTAAYLLNSWVSKILLGLPLVLGVMFFTHYLFSEPAVISGLRWSLIFFISGLFCNSLLAVFRAHQVMPPLLWLALAEQAILFTGLVGLLWWHMPLFMIIIWLGVSRGGQGLLALWAYYRLPNAQALDWRLIKFSTMKSLLLKSWLFFVSGMLVSVQFRVSVLLLAYLQNEQALALYGVANSFIEGFNRLYGAFYTAMLPALTTSLQQKSQQPALTQTLQRAYLSLFGLSLLLAFGVNLVAAPLLTLIYGSAYRPATLTLQILMLFLIPASQKQLLIIELYAHQRENLVNWGLALGIVITFALSFLLVPTWGAPGTAMALLVAETAVYLFYKFYFRQD